MTPLAYAAAENNIDVAQVLLDHGADMNLTNEDMVVSKVGVNRQDTMIKSSNTTSYENSCSEEVKKRFFTAVEYLIDIGEMFQFSERCDLLFPQPDIFVNTCRVFLDHDMHNKMGSVDFLINIR